jgi:mannitol-1-phosphate/altronate dehydrogenase
MMKRIPYLTAPNLVLTLPSHCSSCSYASDTVDRHGVLSTVTVRNVAAAFSGSDSSTSDYETYLSQQDVRIELIAVGVTEAGLAEGSPAMVLLARSLEILLQTQPQQRVSIIDLDNVSGNGDKIKRLMLSHFAAAPACLAYLASCASFHNSVVDRITAARPDNSLVPRGEPIPHKVRARLFSCLRGQ